jgi:lipopolysaccharide export system ATP-binding protein
MQILSTVDLTKSYKGRKIVDGISLRIAQGEVVGLLGPNGAGKTTTFYIIVGLVGPDAGEVLLDGVEISNFPMYLRARNGISFLPQEPSIFRKLTVEENIMAVLETLPLSPHQRRERLEEVIEELGLQQVRRSYGYMLSGGERRRVEIARALVISPSFVLLDEPFSGIDPLTVLDIQRIILQLRAAGIGVLLTDHNVRETLQVTDRAYIINGGRIFRTGTPEELGNDVEVKKIYLGDNFRLAI